MKRPSIKDRDLTPTDELLAGKPLSPQGDKTPKRQQSKPAAQKPQKRSFYLHTAAIEALMREQLRRLKEGASPGEVSYSALVEDAILRQYRK